MFLIDLTDLKTGEKIVYNIEHAASFRLHGDDKKNGAIVYDTGYTEYVKESPSEITLQIVRTLQSQQRPMNLPPGMKIK